MKIVFILLCLFTSIHAQQNGVQYAAVYHHNSHLQWDAAVDFLKQVSWHGNERILDIGCGDGKITASIATQCPSVKIIGLDVSEKMIQFASSNYSDPTFSHLQFIVGNASLLPFEKEFDTIVSFSTLNWVLDQKAALQGIHKSLATDGKVHLLLYAKSRMNLPTLWEEVIASEKWKNHFSSYQQQRVFFYDDEYRKLMEEAGFKNISIQSVASETIYSHRKALVNFLIPLINFIGHLTEEQQIQFIEDVTDNIIYHTDRQQDDTVVLPHLKMQVHAYKND